MSPAESALLTSVDFWLAFGVYWIIDRGAEEWLPLQARYLVCAAGSAAFLWHFGGIGAVFLGALYLGLTITLFAVRAAIGLRGTRAKALAPVSLQSSASSSRSGPWAI